MWIWKRLGIGLFLLAGCGERFVVKVTVAADAAVLQNQEIFSLRVIVDQVGDSGVETIENDGKAIVFPVDFSTRIDAKRFGELGARDDESRVTSGR